MSVLVKPEKTTTRYEVVTLFISTLVSALTVPFYIEATKKAHDHERASSIISNSAINFFVTKVSIDYLYDLLKKGEHFKAAGIVVTAAALYAPQILISVMESNYPLGFTVFAAVATGLSGSFVSSYAVGKMPAFMQSLKVSITQESPSEDKQNILANLSQLLKRVRVSDYRALSTLSCETEQDLLNISLKLGETAKTPLVENDYVVLSAIKLLFQVAVTATLLYGSIGYTCATEESVRKDFHFSPIVAAVLANVLMSFQYILNVKGGFGLVGEIFDNLSLLNYRRLLSNENTLGGWLGVGFVTAAPFLAGFASSFSGVPSKEFCQSCATSQLKPLTFPHFDDVVDYATRCFNGIYVAMAFAWFARYCVERNGSEQDNAYLFVLKSLTDLIDNVKGMSNDDVANKFANSSVREVIAMPTDNAETRTIDVSVDEGSNSKIVLGDLTLAPKEFSIKFFDRSVNPLSSISTGMGYEQRLLAEM